jgi:hypothetical protein
MTNAVNIAQSGSNNVTFRNRIINGAMTVSQRLGTSATANTISDYTLDRWAVNQSTTGKLIVQQNAGSVTPPAGFSNYLGVTSQSAYTVGASDYYLIAQPIEGFNAYDLSFGTSNAKTVTLSFQVYSSLTGTFGGSLRNYAGTRSYPFTYTISSANTWTTISITIAGDTSGTWVGATNAGWGYVYFGLGVGSTYSGTTGSWSGNNYVSATGATSVVGTSGATVYLTGVQLEAGTTASPFEYRQYGTELVLCQRYFAKSYDIATAVGTATRNGYVNWNWQNLSNYGTVTVYLPVRMRAAPTSTNYNPDLTNTVGGRYWNGSAEVAFTGSMDGWTNYQSNIIFNKNSTNSTNMLIQWTADAEL